MLGAFSQGSSREHGVSEAVFAPLLELFEHGEPNRLDFIANGHMPGAESQIGLGMGKMMAPETGTQHDSTAEQPFQKIPSGKIAVHGKSPFFVSPAPPHLLTGCGKT
jgi:hypothetical protein